MIPHLFLLIDKPKTKGAVSPSRKLVWVCRTVCEENESLIELAEYRSVLKMQVRMLLANRVSLRSFVGIAVSKFTLLNTKQDGEAQQGVNVFALKYFKTRPYKELCRRQTPRSVVPFLSRQLFCKQPQRTHSHMGGFNTMFNAANNVLRRRYPVVPLFRDMHVRMTVIIRFDPGCARTVLCLRTTLDACPKAFAHVHAQSLPALSAGSRVEMAMETAGQ